MFKLKEERFEDLLIDEYKYLKEDIFNLLDKDLDGLRKVMSEIDSMTLENIYEKMLAEAQKLGNKDKSKNISEFLEKIKQRQEELNKEKETAKKQEEELRKYKSKKDKPQPKPQSKPEPYEKTTIIVDAKRNKITICLKGKTHPTYEVYNNEKIDGFIKNGKEYKKDKGYKKTFDKRALKKVDPAIFGILVQENMEAAKEYVNSFKDGQKSLVDVKYTFSKETINVPKKALRNYKNYAKKAEERGVATVEGILKRRSPIEILKQWSKTNQAKMLESERMKQDRLARENEVKREEESRFKDEMKKDAPTPQEQAKTAREFGEKESKRAKAPKRERKNRRTQEEVK